ncbi:MAG: type IV secretion system DNA-binding domain-containing protein [Cyanobacteriota bacterium]
MNIIKIPVKKALPTKALFLGQIPHELASDLSYLPLEKRMVHMQVVGNTGTGKTKFLEHLIRQDIEQGNGLILIDPHGDLYKNVLRFCIQKRLHDKVILINPSDSSYTLGFNPITLSEGEDISVKAKELRNACAKAWGIQNFQENPNINRWLYNIFYALLERKRSFFDAIHLSSLDKTNTKRLNIVSRLKNQEIRNEFDTLLKQSQGDLRAELIGARNRIFELLNNISIRKIFTQKNNIDFREAMNSGKIILCNLTTQGGHISEDDQKVLGILIINQLFNYALKRKEDERKPFFVYIDEFSNFITPDIARGLAETRKFAFSFVLAYQFPTQLKKYDESMFYSVMTLARNRVVFGDLLDEDRELLAKELFAPFFDDKEIKDEIYQTKQRSELELRELKSSSISNSETTSDGTTETQAEQKGESVATGTSDGNTVSNGVTQSKTASTSFSHGKSKGVSNGESQVTTASNGKNKTISFNDVKNWSMGSSYSNSTSEGETTNWSTGESHSEANNSSRSSSNTDSESNGRNNGNNKRFGKDEDGNNIDIDFSDNNSESLNTSTSYGSSLSSGSTDTSSSSESSGGGTSSSKSESFSTNESHGGSLGEGNSFGESSSNGTSSGKNTSTSDTTQSSQGKSTAFSEGNTQQTSSSTVKNSSKTVTGSSTKSTGTSSSKSQGVTHSNGNSQTWVSIQKEYKELSSRTYYSHQEKIERAKAWLSKLETGQAFIKVPEQPPFPIKVPHIETLVIKKQEYDGFLTTLAKYNPFFIPKIEADKSFNELSQKQENKPKDSPQKHDTQKKEAKKNFIETEEVMQNNTFEASSLEYDPFNADII